MMNAKNTPPDRYLRLFEAASREARSLYSNGEAGMPMDTNAQIHNLLYEALEAIDAPLDLLQIVGSWGDTMPESETIEQLMAFISAAKSGSKDDGKNS